MITFDVHSDPMNPELDKQWTVEAADHKAAALLVWERYPEARALCDHSPLELAPEDEVPASPEYPINGKKVAWLTVTRSDDGSTGSVFIRFESGHTEWFGLAI